MACLKRFAKKLFYCVLFAFLKKIYALKLIFVTIFGVKNIMKKIYFLIFAAIFFNIPVGYSAVNQCDLILGRTTGNPFLNEGVLDFEAFRIDESISACVNQGGFDDDHFDLKGFALNPNLGYLSFFSEYNPVTQKFENLGVGMKTQLEYGVSLFPEYNNSNQIERALLKGYAYSDGHGWLKFSCQKHPDLEFDEDVCDLFAANDFSDECQVGFGACINFNDYDLRTKTYGVKGHAFSENLGFIDMKGARIKFENTNLNYLPEVVLFNSTMEPLSNGGKFYSLGLKFILNGVDKTKEFNESNAEFCLRFLNNRKLTTDDETQIIQALDCTDHTNLYGSDLNNYNQDAFVYSAKRNAFMLKSDRKIASLVPSTAEEFKIDALKTTLLGKETFYPLNLPLEFKMPMDLVLLPYHIDSFAQCDLNNKLKVLNFTENFNNPFSLCSVFQSSPALSEFEVEHSFETNVENSDLSIDVFELDMDLETQQEVEIERNNWTFSGYNFVSDLFFRFNSTYVVPKELANNKLLFKGSYSFMEDGQSFEVSRVISSMLDDSKSNYTPLIKGVLNDQFFKKMNDGLTIKNVKNDSLNFHTAFVNKYAEKFQDSVCDLNLPCVDRFNNLQDIVYINNLNRPLNSLDIQNFNGDLLVLDGVDFHLSQNILDENFIGIVQNNANTYLKTSVTDLNLMLSTNGYIMSYVDNRNLAYLEAENYADYQDTLDESVYNQLYFKGELRANNCFGCSLENPIVMPNGIQAADLVDSYKARVWDLSLLRRSPLEYKSEVMFGRHFYQNCDGARQGVQIVFDNLNTDFLCYQDELNGVPLLKSTRIQDLELESERALLFDYFDFGLPYFSQ